MSVYYKFNSELNFSHVGFDGLHISVADLKKAILHQKRLGKSDFDLLISNAQTKEEYIEDDCLIPKNTSLIVARVPLTNQYKKWEQQTNTAVHNEQQSISTSSAAHSMDLSKMNGSEEDKIQAMIAQSTLDYDPTNYQRVRLSHQSGEVPHHYRCHRCHKSGHWIKNCPMNPPMKDHHKVRAENKKMTGIPRSLRENPPNTKEPEHHQFVEQKKEIPEDLLCSICKNIFKDAVMIPCCGSSFCDECIRTSLLESDDNECPECSEKGTSPGSLIPNRFLRNAVASFHSDSNSLSSRDKQQESNKHEEIPSSLEPIEEKNIIDDSNRNKIDSFAEVQEHEHPKVSKTADLISENEEEEDDDDDDNITVTVPSASQQSGAEFRESIVVPMLLHRQESWEEPETNVEVREKSKHSREYSDIPSYSGYYQGNNNNNNNNSNNSNNHSKSYDGPQNNNIGSSYQENVDNKSYQAHPMNNPNPYHQSHGYNQQQHHGNMHRPQYPHQGGQYHQSGPSHQPPFYGHNHHQQNMRPMRYEHGNYHGMNKHHNMPPMHAPINDHYGMRYQQPSTNLANIVTQNIQQRFGTGIIEDPLEAFNKIMREKEMRKDRFKRSRSPLRQYSPDMRQKSPIRRKKRTRSFSSGSSNSRSRSRSYERHYPKENVHGRDYRDVRRKHYPTERKKSETRSSRTHRNRTPNEASNVRKSNYENSSSYNENSRQEKSKVLPESSSNNNSNVNNDAVSTNDGEPPPPGDDMAISASSTATVTSTTAPNMNLECQMQQKDDEKSQASEKEKGSADESKHSKKSRERKKHKKESRKKKKEKRDRKEKKSSSSKSNTPEIEAKASPKSSDLMEKVDENLLELENKASKEHLDDTLTEHENDGNDDSKFDDYIEPELSKWERDENHEKNIEQQKSLSHSQHSNTEVTSEIIKRAENAIFAKAVNAIRPQEVNKVSSSKNDSPVTSIVAKKSNDSDKKYESVQVTVPTDNSGNRSIEIKSSEDNSSSRNKSDKPASIKDRLGKKIDIRERSKSRDDKRHQHQDSERKNTRRPYQLNSCISTVSKYSDRRPEKKSTRRSRSPENRSTSRKYDRSRSRSSNRNSHKKQKTIDDKRSHHKSSLDEKHESKYVSDKRTKSIERNRSRHRSRSPKPSISNRSNERRSRSSSAKKKKKKKEKKSKKKSRG